MTGTHKELSAVDRLAQLLRDGVTPVLSSHGLRRTGRDYALRCDDGDLMVVSFDNAATAPKGTAAEVEAGYFPRYFLDRLNERRTTPDRTPHASMAMLHWRIDATPDASYAPERGEPWSSWWALGERTPRTAQALAQTLATAAVPRLLSLRNPETQYAAIEAEWPEPGSDLHHGNKSWDRVLARLGRVSRSDVERLLGRIPSDDMFAGQSARFVQWVRDRLDSMYGP